MKNSVLDIEKTAASSILTILRKIPDLKNIRINEEPLVNDNAVDFRVTCRKQNEKLTLLVEVKSSGQPRYARAAANQLMALQLNNPGAYGVFVAPYISDVAAEICKNSGIGYIDLVGNCWLNFDNVYIEIKGNPNRFSKKRELKSLFKPKAERILRVLLTEPDRQWLTEDLAKSANVSLGQVSNVRKLLLEREWIQDQKRGVVLIEPFQLLDSWLENYAPARNNTIEFYDMGSVAEIELSIGNICNQTKTRYAFTGFSGAARYTPFTTYKTVSVYMDIDSQNYVEELPFKPVTSGANIKIVKPYDEGVYYGSKSIRGQTAASVIQCYLDLKGEKARGEEAAEALFDQEIKPLWT